MSDAWRYASKFDDPEAAKILLQAAVNAHLAIEQARTKIDPEDFGTALDWSKVRQELSVALGAIEHPAGIIEGELPLALNNGHAWMLAENLNDPEAVKQLIQSVLSAHATILFAQTKIDTWEFATVPNWKIVDAELVQALRAAGHPAGAAVDKSIDR